MAAHAPLSPSSAARIVACAGSRAIEAAYPSEPTIDSMEGDAAHWGFAELLNGRDIDVGLVPPNGVTLNVEMCDAAYMGAVHIISRPCGVGQVEQLCGSGALHPQNYGTPDHWQYDDEDDHLYVDDFKYGRAFVDEFGNWQLINYVALIAHERGYAHPGLKVTMTIIQPRCYHRRGQIRSVTTTFGALGMAFATLRRSFELAMMPDARVTASNLDQCRKCSGRHVCEATLMGSQIAEDVSYESTPLELSPAAMAQELKRLRHAEKMIKLRREGIEEATLSSIKRGKHVPFFRIEHTKGRTVFRDDALQAGLLDIATAFNVKVSKDALITPLQAIKAGIPEDVVKLYSHTPGGAAELIEDDGTFAATIFKG